MSGDLGEFLKARFCEMMADLREVALTEDLEGVKMCDLTLSRSSSLQALAVMMRISAGIRLKESWGMGVSRDLHGGT